MQAMMTWPSPGREGVVRHVDEVRVADPARNVARHQVHRRHVGEERDLGVEHRHVDMLAEAGDMARLERGEHAHRAEDAAAEVADRNAAAHRRVVGPAGDAHAAAHALHDLVERRPLRVGAGLAEAGDRAGDDPGIDRRKRRVVDLEALRHAGAEVVEHHVGLAHQVVEDRPPRLLLEVDADALLAAVERHEVRAHAVARIVGMAGKQFARAFALAGRLDLDRSRAQIGECHRPVRTRQHVGQVEDGDAGEGSHVVGRRFVAQGLTAPVSL